MYNTNTYHQKPGFLQERYEVGPQSEDFRQRANDSELKTWAKSIVLEIEIPANQILCREVRGQSLRNRNHSWEEPLLKPVRKGQGETCLHMVEAGDALIEHLLPGSKKECRLRVLWTQVRVAGGWGLGSTEEGGSYSAT